MILKSHNLKSHCIICTSLKSGEEKKKKPWLKNKKSPFILEWSKSDHKIAYFFSL